MSLLGSVLRCLKGRPSLGELTVGLGTADAGTLQDTIDANRGSGSHGANAGKDADRDQKQQTDGSERCSDCDKDDGSAFALLGSSHCTFGCSDPLG
ncbi:hypothetical protein MHAS44199_16345 [Mycolicibacterium hassiacum DSM 44199]|nr:hypothetical protein [Mycolicibacterium hassiacum DSM 44199]